MSKQSHRAQKRAEKKNKRAKAAKKCVARRKRDRDSRTVKVIEESALAEKGVDHSLIADNIVSAPHLVTDKATSAMIQRSMHRIASEWRNFDESTDIREDIERYAEFQELDGVMTKCVYLTGIVADAAFGWDVEELRERAPILLTGISWDEQIQEAAMMLRAIMLVNPRVIDRKRKVNRPLKSSHIWLNVRDFGTMPDDNPKIRLYDRLTVFGAIQRYETVGIHGNITKRWGVSRWAPLESVQCYSFNDRMHKTPTHIDRPGTLIAYKHPNPSVYTVRKDEFERDLESIANFQHPDFLEVMLAQKKGK